MSADLIQVRLWVSAALLACLTGCFTPSAERRAASELALFALEPPEAEIWVDGAYRGRLDRWRDNAVPLPIGRRRVELRAKGYIPRRLDLEVRPGEKLRVEVQLTPDPDSITWHD